MQQIYQEIRRAKNTLASMGKVRKSQKWQGMEKASGHELFEINNFTLESPIPSTLSQLKEQCIPNLPWADEHFKERVGGLPLNPGEQYKNWPFYPKDNDSQIRQEKFTHTYMERFWPKHANRQDDRITKRGIRYDYGDLQDVIDLLQREPDTRQAYLPIWFPEDTGSVHGGRVPCTLGYLFNVRDEQLHITYYIRSCDYLRHFQDDIYLACRLVHYILHKLQYNEKAINDNSWQDVTPGTITMHIANLHVFATEAQLIKKP